MRTSWIVLLSLILLIGADAFAGVNRWKLTFEDDFDSNQTGECYQPQKLFCSTEWGTNHLRPCPDRYHPGLRDLNKCTWIVDDRYNGYPQEPVAKGSNAFHPDLVEVSGGVLKLWARDSFYPGLDCNPGNRCPILSGAINSLGGFGTQSLAEAGLAAGLAPVGFEQKYGRFEVRARMSETPGTWPAAWTLAHAPQTIEGILHQAPWPGDMQGWPGDGEFDLMEYYGRHPGRIEQTFHTVERMSSKAVTRGGKLVLDPAVFHVYALEWDPTHAEFFTDGESVARIYGTDVHVPTVAQVWLLNVSVIGKEWKPGSVAWMEVDWARAYRRCDFNEQGCVSRDNGPVASLFPNPARSGSAVTLEALSPRDCRESVFTLYSSAGALVSVLGRTPLWKDQLYRLQIVLPHLAPDLYILNGVYNGCEGNGSIQKSTMKLLIL